jgi:hypothetical protein
MAIDMTDTLLYDSQINVGLLECNTPQRYEALGRMVIECLMRG